MKKNIAYANNHIKQVYTITLRKDSFGEVTVNSLQKAEWVWQSKEIELPFMSVNSSSAMLMTVSYLAVRILCE